jgi:hypothetical protein
MQFGIVSRGLIPQRVVLRNPIPDALEVFLLSTIETRYLANEVGEGHINEFVPTTAQDGLKGP